MSGGSQRRLVIRRADMCRASPCQIPGSRPAKRRPVLAIQPGPSKDSRLPAASGVPEDSVVNVAALVTLDKTDPPPRRARFLCIADTQISPICMLFGSYRHGQVGAPIGGSRSRLVTVIGALVIAFSDLDGEEPSEGDPVAAGCMTSTYGAVAVAGSMSMASRTSHRRTVIWLLLAGASRISIRPSPLFLYQPLSSLRFWSLAE